MVEVELGAVVDLARVCSSRCDEIAEDLHAHELIPSGTAEKVRIVVLLAMVILSRQQVVTCYISVVPGFVPYVSGCGRFVFQKSACNFPLFHMTSKKLLAMRLPNPASLRKCLAGPSVPRVVPQIAPVTRRASTSSQPLSILPQITTLPNKLRVVTEAAPTYVHSLGVFIDGGTRFESERTSGVTHLLDKMAFKVSGKSLLYRFERNVYGVIRHLFKR